MVVNGKDIPGLPNNLELPRPWRDLMSLADYAKLIGKDSSYIRHKIADGKLKPELDCMMYGKQWVIHGPDTTLALFGSIDIWNRYLYDCRADMMNRGLAPPKNIW